MATNQMQFGLGFEVHVDEQRMKKRDYKEIQLDIIGALPGVGPVLAKAMLKNHGSLQSVFSADSEELNATEGLDEARVEILTKLFEYKG